LISHRYKCIFIHLRRTGGNSVEHALDGIRLLDKAGNATDVWDNRLHRGRTPYKIDQRGHFIHDTAVAIRDQYPTEFEAYFKFSFVRNPWAQMLSIFLRKKEAKGATESFSDFVSAYDTVEGTVPRHSLFDGDGSLLVDYVGRFETLADDFETVSSSVGLPSGKLRKLNTSKSVDYRTFYTDDTASAVARLFRDDIEAYGYQF
jgi:hypothetical protein